MLSQTVEYALRAMVYLASSPDEPQSTDSVAAVTKVPPAYLSKVLQNLTRKGLSRPQPGLRAGFTLALPPDQITVLEVVEAVDPIQRIRTCPLGLAKHGVKLCPLHRRLDNALAMVEEAFRNSTLAEILAEPTESIASCDFPTSGGG